MKNAIVDAKITECLGNEWFVCVNIYRNGVRNDNPEQHMESFKTIKGAVNFAKRFNPTSSMSLTVANKNEKPWWVADREAGYKFND